MTALSGFYFTDCADYHVTDATLGNYGLAEDQRMKVELTYKDTSDDDKEKTVTFYVEARTTVRPTIMYRWTVHKE